jgi:catechol 2,3-dioxygenase-like lactoylglutathione lyase family enzyme
MTDPDAFLARVTELGRERIRMAGSIAPERWKEEWPEPKVAFPFALDGWKQCLCYVVDDYAAEVGFYVDVLGLPAPLFGPDNALLTSPGKDFYFQIAEVTEDEKATPPDTIGLMFYVSNMMEACAELESRGVVFDDPPTPMGGPDSTFYSAEFHSPHGVAVNLWGVVPK